VRIPGKIHPKSAPVLHLSRDSREIAPSSLRFNNRAMRVSEFDLAMGEMICLTSMALRRVRKDGIRFSWNAVTMAEYFG